MIGVVVEGETDLPVLARILSSEGLQLDGRRSVVCGGKDALDARLPKYQQAGRYSPWLVLRDSDRDAGDCPAALVRTLLPAGPSDHMCLRLAVRSVESWLLADASSFSTFFGVPQARVPPQPDDETDPKRTLVDLCRSSRRPEIRRGVPPRPRSGRKVGPEYRAFVQEYASNWDPSVAAAVSPSLSRGVDAIRRLVGSGRWPGS